MALRAASLHGVCVDLPMEVIRTMTKQSNIRNFSIIAHIDLVVAGSASLAST